MLTAVGTLISKRPGTVALCVTGLTGVIVTFQKDAFLGMAVIIALVCAFPVTIVTAVVTDNLMDKYADWRSGRQGSTTNKGFFVTRSRSSAAQARESTG